MSMQVKRALNKQTIYSANVCDVIIGKTGDTYTA